MLALPGIALVIALALVACLETGRQMRLRQRMPDTDIGIGVIETAVFGLLGLLLAFTFYGADGRFAAHRQLLVQETNAISTVYRRVNLLPAASQSQIRADLRDYVDSRVAFYGDASIHTDYVPRDIARFQALQQKIWQESIESARTDPSGATLTLMTSSLNDMINVTSAYSEVLRTHPPLEIYFLLLVLTLSGALLAGYRLGEQPRHPWLHAVVFAMAFTLTLYTIIDLEFPRYGINRLARYDQALVNLRDSMK